MAAWFSLANEHCFSSKAIFASIDRDKTIVLMSQNLFILSVFKQRIIKMT